MKKGTLLSIALLSVSCLVNPLNGVSKTYALFNNVPKIETSKVEDDLDSSKEFNKNEYLSINRIKPIELVEYSYSKMLTDDYNLYFYLAKPSSLNIDYASNLNNIELGINGFNYKKYKLLSLDHSLNFAKFKIDLSDFQKNNILNELNSDKRIYSVSSIELLENGLKNATDNQIGGNYSYSGYAFGMNIESTNSSTLTCAVNELETLSLNVNHTSYLFKTIDQCLQTQLNSVYFSVPNLILKEYGNLDAIHCEYYEYKTSPIFVLKTTDYNIFKTSVGIKQTTSNHGDYALMTSSENTVATSIGGGCYYSYSNVTTPMGAIYCNNSNIHTDTINYLFDGGSDGFNNISSSDLSNYIYSYDKSFALGKNYKGISMDLLTGEVDNGHLRGFNDITIKSSDNYSLTTFAGNNGWDYFLNIFNRSEDVVNVKPIEKIETIVAKSNDDLFIDTNDWVNFASFYNKSLLDNNSVFLFRFNSGSYFSDRICDYKYGDATYIGTDGYVAQENIFLDFDIIDLTFSKNGIYKSMPIVNSPIDIIPSIHAPVDELWGGILKVLKIILIILSILIGIWLIDKIFNIFGINIIDLISKPFKNKKKK